MIILIGIKKIISYIYVISEITRFSFKIMFKFKNTFLNQKIV